MSGNTPKYDCSMGDPLDMLAEECAEVIQALMKARRFGMGGAPGYTGIKPRAEITKEIGDVLACIELLCTGYVEEPFDIGQFEEAKQRKLAELCTYFRPAL